MPQTKHEIQAILAAAGSEPRHRFGQNFMIDQNLLRIVADGEAVVSEVEVPHAAMGVHRVASFWNVRDGKIVGGREYWTELGTDPSPEWRAAYVQRV